MGNLNGAMAWVIATGTDSCRGSSSWVDAAPESDFPIRPERIE